MTTKKQLLKVANKASKLSLKSYREDQKLRKMFSEYLGFDLDELSEGSSDSYIDAIEVAPSGVVSEETIGNIIEEFKRAIKQGPSTGKGAE